MASRLLRILPLAAFLTLAQPLPAADDPIEPPSLATFVSDELLQSVEVGPGGRRIVVRDVERHGGVEYEATRTLDLPFALRLLDSRWAHELYLLGVDDEGREVLERWVLRPPAGAIVVLRPAPAGPIGTPAPLDVEVRTAVRGGRFLPPDQREAAAPVERTVLARGIGGGQSRDLLVEPEGRFVLLLAGDGTLLRIPCPAAGEEPGEPRPIASPSDHPLLREARDLHLYLDPGLGRILGVESPQGGLLEFVDGEADGIFDAPTLHPDGTAWHREVQGRPGVDLSARHAPRGA